VDDPKSEFEVIEEEEEKIVHKERPELKELLKIRGRAILF